MNTPYCREPGYMVSEYIMLEDNNPYIISLPDKEVICFKTPTEKDGGGASHTTEIVEDEILEETPDSDEFILCRHCKQILTSPGEGISVNGSHKHVFANPHGIIFEIACFNTVVGCSHTGPPFSEWSWFPGYTWQIALCGKCLINVGWLFASSSLHTFYGLILERLIGTL